MCGIRRHAARGLLAVFMLASGACSREAAERGTRVDVTDSAGVWIAFTRIAEDAPRCEVVGESLRVGAADGTQGAALYGVNSAAVLDDGRIAIANRGSSQVKVFSPTGEPISEFGRRGQGPGEFRNLWSVHVRGGDTLVVGDYRPWRFSFFMPDGALLRQVELRPVVIERPDFAIPLEPGAGFVLEEPSFQVGDEMADRVVPLRTYAEDGENTGTVGDFWLDRYGYLSRELRYVGNPIFGARASFAHFRDDLILYATGRHEQLEIWNVSGELEGIVRWESRDRTVPPGDAVAWRRARREEIESRVQITPEMEPVIQAQTGDHVPVAEEYPGHDNVLVSRDGDMWVEEYRRPADQGPARWWVFQPDGRFRCSASLPQGIRRVLAVDGNRVLGLVLDSLDVEYVVGYDFETPGQ